MEYTNPNSAIDHVAIINRANRERAKATAAAGRAFRAWVARQWVRLTQRRGQQTA